MRNSNFHFHFKIEILKANLDSYVKFIKSSLNYCVMATINGNISFFFFLISFILCNDLPACDATIIIPDNITTILPSQYANCHVQTLTLPEGLTEIQNSSFRNCTQLTELNIPSSVKNIGDFAFEKCTSLSSLTFGGSVQSIGNYAFSYCSSITSISFGNQPLNISDYAFYGCTGITNELVIPTNVNFVGKYAFSETSIPSFQYDNLVTVPEGLFCNCSHLTGTLDLSKAVEIGQFAFENCGFQEIVFGSTLETIGAHAFYHSSIENLSLPSNLQTIGDYAFAYSSKLVNITTFPNSMTELGKFAFSGCSILESLSSFPTNLITISEGTFKDCEKLTSEFTFPSDLTEIGPEAFYGCRMINIKELVIPETVTNIGAFAFYGCSKIERIQFNSKLDTISDSCFRDCENLESVDIPYNIQVVGSSAFYNSGLTTVTFNEGLRKIGENSFRLCHLNGTISFPDSLTEISSSAFKDQEMEGITFGSNLETLGDSVFEGCTKITSVVLPNALISIGTGAFCKCTSLKSVILGDGIKTVPTNCFCNCTSLTETVDLSKGVSMISSGAFQNCPFNYVNLGNQITTIGEFAFNNCSNLCEVRIPDSVEVIQQYAFCSCENLSLLTLGEKVVEIGDYAFQHCPKLSGQLVIPASVIYIGKEAFIHSNYTEFNFSGIIEPVCFDNSISDKNDAIVYVTADYMNTSFCSVSVKAPDEPISSSLEEESSSVIDEQISSDIVEPTPTSTSTPTSIITPPSTFTPTSIITQPSTFTPTSIVTQPSTFTPTSIVTPASTATPTSIVTPPSTFTPTSIITPTMAPQLTCIDIVPNCTQCNDTNPTVCIGCILGYTLVNGYCYKECCSSYVLHCKRCSESDSECTECEEGCGLNAGSCTKCGTDLFEDGFSPCKLDCSFIPHCTDCAQENNQFYCYSCEDKYQLSDDFTMCVEMPIDSNGCIKIPGCLKCDPDDPFTCKECSTEQHFVLNDDGECDCSDGYNLYEDQCYANTSFICNSDVLNCTTCIENSICIYCDYGFGLVDGSCVKCEEGKYVSSDEPCLPNCDSILNCTECELGEDQQLICRECDDGYIVSTDGKTCYEIEGVNCTNVEGCSLCLKADPSICIECDEENHFVFSSFIPGRCVCEEEYDFFNGQCLPPISPVTPAPTPEAEEISDSQISETIANGKNTTTIKEDAVNPDTIYKYQIKESVDVFEIPEKVKQIQLSFPLRGDKELTINCSSETEVFIDIINKANLVIPPNNDNISITGDGNLSLKASEASDEIRIKKLIPQGDDGIFLNSQESDIVIDQVQVFGSTKINGQEGGKTTRIENLFVESGSEFTPTNLIVSAVKIGLNSVLRLNSQTVGTNRTQITVFYNRTQYTNRHFPIEISEVLPDFSNARIIVDQMNDGAFIQEVEERIPIASFDQIDSENAEKACNDLRGKYESRTGFNKAVCEENGNTTVNMFAVKDTSKPKSKKLSTGAIVGIAVACVVVVILMVLLIVFLARKKNDESLSDYEGPISEDSVGL